MKSIKPGRGPSMMGAFGSAAVTIFGVVWTFSTVSMGAPMFFAFFGIIFVILGIVQTIYNLKNTIGKNRFSVYDLTDSNEESDPLNKHFSKESSWSTLEESDDNIDIRYCPYCGDKVEKDYLFCKKCGHRLPFN